MHDSWHDINLSRWVKTAQQWAFLNFFTCSCCVSLHISKDVPWIKPSTNVKENVFSAFRLGDVFMVFHNTGVSVRESRIEIGKERKMPSCSYANECGPIIPWLSIPPEMWTVQLCTTGIHAVHFLSACTQKTLIQLHIYIHVVWIKFTPRRLPQ